MRLVVISLCILIAAHIPKWLLWSGTFPPHHGWSHRQMRRMLRGKSPWTWKCWITYQSERSKEINEVLKEYQ